MAKKIDKINVIFDDWKSICKYYYPAFDKDYRLIDSCRHSDNIPLGCSWGRCEKNICPFLNKKGDIYDKS